MSSGSHLSRNLATLIKTIGETRSKEQQDQIIKYQVNNLKVSLGLNLREQDYFQIMIKMLYIQTLGHDADFAYIHPVNLCQSKKPKIKRLAYLLTTLCINRNNKLSILMLSTIQKDLTSLDLNSVMYCLTALPKIINKTIIQGSFQSILKLLKHPTDLVRKKTLIVLQKIFQISPEIFPTFKTTLQEAIQDDQPPVVFIAISLLKKLIQKSPDEYKQMTEIFCKVLKDIVQHKYPKEYDYHKVPAPWIQIIILKILESLGRNDQKTSSKMYDILQKTLRRATYNQMHINNAIVIQCIKTISSVYPNIPLIRQSQNFVWRFFQKENNNLKSFGISTLTHMVKVQPLAIKNWQFIILQCLDSQDTTLAAITVNLLIEIANEENSQTILDKLLSLAMKSTDYYFQIKLIKKSLILIQRFSKSPIQYIRRMNDILTKFQFIVDYKSLNGYINILIEAIDSNQGLQQILIEEYKTLLSSTTNKHIIRVGVWIIGQYASKCYKNAIDQDQKIEQLTLVLMSVLQNSQEQQIQCILTSLIKLTHHEKFNKHQQMKQLLLELQKHHSFGIHSKAEEFMRLAKFASALKNSKNLVIDKNLSFLNTYVKAHDQKKQIKPSSIQLKKLNSANKNEVTTQLNMRPYPLKTVLDNRKLAQQQFKQSTNLALVQLQDDTILKFTGPKKWTPEGYIQKKPQPQMEIKQVPTSYISTNSQKKQQELVLRGPQQKKATNAHNQRNVVDQRKANLAKSIFGNTK